MQLHLSNGYPLDYPGGMSQAEQDRAIEAAPEQRLTLAGVAHLEWKYVLAIRFASATDLQAAAVRTGWPRHPDAHDTLIVATSVGAGYPQPAIVAGALAYCAFTVLP